jgi:hypothetical protein
VRLLFVLSLEEQKSQPKPELVTHTQPPDLFSVPEVRAAIPKLVDIVEWHYKDRSKSNLKVTYIFVVLLAGLTIGAFALAILHFISGETVIFLIGSLFGYIFAFLQRYLGPTS